MKKCVNETFDKFNQSTKIETIPLKDQPIGSLMLVKYENFGCNLLASLSYIKSVNGDSLQIVLRYINEEWMFLRNGELRFVIDNENINLNSIELSSDNTSGRVWEVAGYRIDKSLLEKICNSKNMAIRITGSKSNEDIVQKNCDLFRILCQQFYNNVFDQTKYLESTEKSLVIEEKGCFIATAAMGNYNHPVVMDLRMFRDNWLLQRDWGVSFTRWYYQHGPKAANVIEKSTILKKITFYMIVKPLQIITKNLK